MNKLIVKLVFLLFMFFDLKVQAQNNDCVRGVAEPIIKKSVLRHSTFIIQKDSLTAIETVLFENNDKLVIHNWGCAYYTLTFRFESSRFSSDTSNHEFWYKVAYSLMDEIKLGVDAPINIGLGLNALKKFISTHPKRLILGSEIDFGGKEIRDFVSVDRIEKMSENRYAIEISFVTGPL